MDKKYKELLSDTIIFAIGNFGSKIIVFFLVPFYTYYLSPEEYGTADLVFTISQLVIPVVSVVIFDAVIRFALIKENKPQDVLLTGIIVWGIGTVAAFGLTPLLSLYKSVSEWKYYVSLYITSSILLSIFLNYFKATNRNMLYSIACIFQTLSLACLNIYYVAHLKLGVQGYLTSYVGSNILTCILCLMFGKIIKDLTRAAFNKLLSIEMVKYSYPLILNNVSWWVIQSSNKIMIEAYLGAGELGLYNVAARIPSLINVFVTIFQQAWGISSIKEMDSSNDKSFYNSVFEFLSLFVFSACIMLCAIIKLFMDVYVTNDAYANCWRYIPLLLCSAVFSAISGFFGSMYGALKKTVNNMVSTLYGAIINLGINFVLIRLIGVWGAIIGTVACYGFLAVYRIVDVQKYVKMNIGKDVIYNSLLILIQAIVVSFSNEIIGYLCSAIIIVLFICINKNSLFSLINMIKKRLKNV